MAYEVYITVTGAKQGKFKGGVTQKGREGKIRAIAVTYGVHTPRDPASGLPTGRHQEKPVTFALEWDTSSPQFFAAAFANESLSTVVIEYYATGRSGVSKVDHTVTLKNANIADITQSYAAKVNGVVDGRDIQTVSVTFQKIEISSTNGTTAADDWEQNV